MITKEDIIEKVLKEYQDPELHIDVWTLGLIYDVTVRENGSVSILLTFTTITCPFGPQMVEEIETRVKELGVSEVSVEVTFDPPWKPTDELREMLGVL